MYSPGIIVLKYNNIFHTFLNVYKSCPSRLGKFIIKDLKKYINESKIEEIKELITQMPTDFVNEEGEPIYEGLLSSVKYPRGFYYRSSYIEFESEPTYDEDIKYIYLIDFDNLTLKITINEFNEYNEYNKPNEINQVKCLKIMTFKFVDIPNIPENYIDKLGIMFNF